MTVHSRRAANAVLDAYGAMPGSGTMILHWFTGTPAELRRAIALGCWFSVGPAMTQSSRGRELLAAMPSSRVLTETDGPFATGKGGPLNPGDVGAAISACAVAWKMDIDEAQKLIANNLREVGRLTLGG